MYSFPSTSHMRDPAARATKNGSAPTLRSARTGEFTPAGIRAFARANNSDEREVIEFDVQRPTSNVQRPTPSCRMAAKRDRYSKESKIANLKAKMVMRG